MSDPVKECCANCKNRLTLERWDYRKVHTGVWKEIMDDYVCTVLDREGEAIWMVGTDPEKAHCEMWTERKQNADRLES